GQRHRGAVPMSAIHREWRIGDCGVIPVRLCAALLLIAAGCGISPAPTVDPFWAPPLPLDGITPTLAGCIVNPGSQKKGQVIRVLATGSGLGSVMMLRQDDQTPDAGVIVGGGPAGRAFDYRIPSDGVYAVYTQFDSTVPQSSRSGQLTVSIGD